MLRRSFVTHRFSFSLRLRSYAVACSRRRKPPAAPINLNTATSEELQLVPGIGPVTAEKILQMRKSYGAFKSVDDLRAVRGIGPKRLEKMRKYLTVGKAASAEQTRVSRESRSSVEACSSAKAFHGSRGSA